MHFLSNIIITILVLLISFTGIAQREREADISKYLPHIISLPAAEIKYKTLEPISSIEVFDARYDTSNVGLIQKPAGAREKMIRFKHGTTGEIRNYYRSLVGSDSIPGVSSAITLVCFIKKLILSDKIYVDGNKKVSPNDPVYEIKSGGMAMFEFYTKQNNDFLPLYRFDTTITGEKDVFYKGQNYIAGILAASLRQLETLNLGKIKSFGNPKSRSAIDSFNNARFTIPILKEHPRKGIYVNFEDFKNNKPVDSPFTVDNGSKGDFLYIKNKKGEDVLQTDIWGYSDGKDSYIYSAENFFKLVRTGNTFMVYGAKDFTSSRRLRLNFSLIDAAIPNSNYSKPRTVNSYSLISNFFQLDMDSGELY